MKNLRQSWARFELRNRDKGIPNLMLWLGGIKLVVFLLMQMDRSGMLFAALCFSPPLILKGQIWRLISYLLLPDSSGILGFALSLLFYYFVGRSLEASMGRFRFNLFYFANALILSLLGVIIGLVAHWVYLPMSLFADFSLLFALATVSPDSSIYLFYVIPIRMKYFTWLETLYILSYLFSQSFPINLLAPLSLVPYFLFFGKNCVYLLPDALQIRIRRGRPKKPPKPKPSLNWASKYQSKDGQKPYHHKCTVCGKTDTEYPNLEFRYCSRCNGYYCYCSEHINNHVHIQ